MKALFVILFSCYSIVLMGQVQDSTLRLLSQADRAIYTVSAEGDELDTLIGNVVIIQDTLYISSDRAYISNKIHARTEGNVIIVSGDSTHIYSQRAEYDGLEQLAKLDGEVILDHGGRMLYTDAMTYDVDRRFATYRSGGTLVDDQTKLVSREGDYDLATGLATFRYNVTYQDSSTQMVADSIELDYTNQRIRFIAPTRIEVDSTSIYCESGLYSIRGQQGVLSQNVNIKTSDRYITAGLLEYDGKQQTYKMYFDPVIEDSTSISRGDTIYYDAESGLVSILGNASYHSKERNVVSDQIFYNTKEDIFTTVGNAELRDGTRSIVADQVQQTSPETTLATGGVVLRDTAQGIELWTDYLSSHTNGEGSLAYGDSVAPMLIYDLGETDSLTVVADTLRLVQSDSMDVFTGQRDVSIFSGGMTGICDSLYFDTRDSVFVLIGRPTLWMDSTQLYADTIKMYLSGGELSHMELIETAFIINLKDPQLYDQINGKRITGLLKKGNIDKAIVHQNARMVYNVIDGNGESQGLSTTTAVEMTFGFEKGQVQSIEYTKPESKYYTAETDVLDEVKRIAGFEWRMDQRPSIDILAQRKK